MSNSESYSDAQSPREEIPSADENVVQFTEVDPGITQQSPFEMSEIRQSGEF